MIYIVANYYIGPMCRYDGTGNTDLATILLFEKEEKAIQHVIDKIIEEILHSNEDLDLNESLTEDEILKIKKILKK